MSDQERGAYTPQTEEPLSFQHHTPPPAPRAPAPLALIASGIILLVLILAVVLFYNSGLNGRKGVPEEVGQPIGPVKMDPTEEAQPLEEGANLNVFEGNKPEGTPTFAPGPETPQTRPAEVVSIAPPPAASGTPSTTVPLDTAPASPVAEQKPEPKPEPKPEAKPETKPEPKPEARVTSSGPAMVQIGAYSSRAIADAEFAALASSFGALASGASKRVEPVERDGKTLYRTSFAGFSSKERAQAFCDALKSSGKSCFVK